ncbi:MAG: histone [archaeon]|nr:histone [archaeon]
MKELPVAPFERILKKANAKRVSEEAAKELCNIMEDIANDFAAEAVKAANHAKRKTVKDIDITFVTTDKPL